MRFSKKQFKKRIWIIIPIVLLAGGIYILITVLSPAIPPTSKSEAALQHDATTLEIKENRLYVPKIGVDVAINEGKTHAVLEKGAWHRKPENGNPEKGGNFVLSAHRFRMGFTPQQTRARSPFYHIDKLELGEKIYVDYNGKRYTYEITKKYKVDRNAVEIEAPSTEAKLTLYSCDLRGEAAGREVIEARPVQNT